MKKINKAQLVELKGMIDKIINEAENFKVYNHTTKDYEDFRNGSQNKPVRFKSSNGLNVPQQSDYENKWEKFSKDDSKLKTQMGKYNKPDSLSETDNPNEPLTFIKGWGYWDVSKYPYGGDFKRFLGTETGNLIKGTVKKGEEIRAKLSDGRTIVTSARSVSNCDFDDLLDKAKQIGRTVV